MPLYEKSIKGVVYVALFVDDNWMEGNPEEIDETIEAPWKSSSVLKVMEGLQDYLSCKVRFLLDKKRTWLWQSHIIESFYNKFEDQVDKVHNHMPSKTKIFYKR